MKVERANRVFTPITITIESEEQLRIFRDLLEVAYDESYSDSETETMAEDLQKQLKSVLA